MIEFPRLEGVISDRKRVIRNPGDVPDVVNPFAGWRNVVRRALTLHFDEKREPLDILPVPGGEGVEEPQTVVARVDLDHLRLKGCRVAARAGSGKALRRELISVRDFELHRLSVLPRHGIRHRVEGETAAERVSDRDIRRHEERLCERIPVVTLPEVAVEAVNNRVLTLRVVLPVPHADARSAGVREHRDAEFLEDLRETVAVHRGLHEVGAWRQEHRALHRNPVIERLLRDGGGARNVFVG